MKRARQHLRWLHQPQLLLIAVLACLGVSALGSLDRPAPLTGSDQQATQGPDAALDLGTPVSDCSPKACIALTFDDGPDPLTTPPILDVLADEHVPATFFLVGQRVHGNEALVRRMYRQGEEIGNHSWNHPDFTKLSQAQIAEQIQKTQVAIMNAGVPAPYLIRPPYGSVDPGVLNQLHMTAVEWNIDPEDWQLRDPAKIDANIIAHAKPGGIIIMHDIYPSTVAALRPAIDTLKLHYRLVTVSQLLHLTPGDQGQYFGHYY